MPANDTEIEQAFTQGLIHGLNTADEILMALASYVDHSADCMFHRTDSPEGDVCVCRVQARWRELKAMVKRKRDTAELLAKSAREVR